ncbi:MAG: DNA primase [Myxococcota bacterium]
MGNRIPENVINELRDRCDIVDYISRYVTLKKRGSNYMGLCPFHKEKTPSFVVSREKKIFHCFGCGEGGNLFNFLSKIESKGFYQVVRELAQEKGIAIDIDQEMDEVSLKKNRLISIHHEAMKYYHQSLYSEEGSDALNYLKKRGITENLIIEHNLGYSPADSSQLYNKLLKLGFSVEDLMDSGIFSGSHLSPQDRFSRRLIIPLIDIDRKVIAFAGRNLDNRGDSSKYINSPESPIYHKNSFLYGLNIASRYIHKAGYLIVVEGYFDLISLNGANIYNVVATCGTAFTQSHARLIKRLTKDIFLCFDGDSAGRSAIYKAVKTLLPSGLNIYIISLPERDDPDTFVRREGHQGFSEILKASTPFLLYLARDVKRVINQKPHMRATFIKKMLSYIQLLPDILEQREAIRAISKEIDTEEDVIYSYLKGTLRKDTVNIASKTISKYKSYEIWLISILFQFPNLLENLPEDILNLIESREIADTYKEISSQYRSGMEGTINLQDSKLFPAITEVMMSQTFPNNESDAFSLLLDCIHRIQIDKLKRDLKEIDANIHLAKKRGDENILNSLIKKKIELSKSIQLREIKYG